MKLFRNNILILLTLLIGLSFITSCELMDKKEKDEFDSDAFFSNKLPTRKVVLESISQETVIVKEKASIVKMESDDFDALDDVKTREAEKKLPPFYEEYLKGDKGLIPIFIELDATSIQDIIPAFAKLLGFSYAIDPGVKGAVTLSVNNPKAKDKKLLMPKREVWKLFEQILWMSGAYCSPEDDILHIMPFQKMARERSIFGKEGNSANVAVRIFDIYNVPAKNVLDKLTDFLTEGAKASELAGENAIMIVETPDNMPKLEILIKTLDNKHRTLWPRVVIQCANVSASRIAEELGSILPVLGFSVTVDKAVAEPGSIHFSTIDRLQVLIASAANKEALDEVIKWCAVLDRSDVGDQEQVYIYKVINSKSEELLQALATIFTIDGTSMSVKSASKGAAKASTSSIKSSKTSKTKSKAGPANIFEVPVKVFADGKNNRLIIRTTPRAYVMIKALLYRLDTIPVQVLLQVMIAEVRLNENNEFGIELAGVLDNFGKSGMVSTDFAGLNPQDYTNEKGFQYLVGNGEDKYAYVRGLAGTGNLKILSSPQLAALSGTEATLDVGQEIPIITRTLSDTNGLAGQSTSNDVEYKKTGVILKITPQVTKGGLITIELDQTVSDRGEDVSAGGSTYPSFINRQVVTTLSMRDGGTLLVGGIIQELDRSTNDSVPLIAEVPMLATIFGYNTKNTTRTELLIMITASVISEDSKLEKMIGRYKQSIKTIKDFNKSLEPTKKKELKIQ